MNKEMYDHLKAACLNAGAELVAVSKTRSIEEIRIMYAAGQRIFGENRVQELMQKQPLLPEDIEWHLIGHLQSNKVKYIAPFISMIHSAESMNLLKTIDKEAAKNNRTIDVLLQFHIAEEETKFGLNIEEAEQILASENFRSLKNIRVCGVMGMATNTENVLKIKSEFGALRQIYDLLKQKYFLSHDCFRHISMGMSSDYEIALNEGSTIIRVGSLLFE
jgi:PLP dependent protein